LAVTHLAAYVDLLREGERALAGSLRRVADRHAGDCDVDDVCRHLAELSDEHADRLDRLAGRYGPPPADRPDRWYPEGLGEPRSGPLGLVRDLQDLHALCTLLATSWAVLCQAAQGARDRDLLGLAEHCAAGTDRQVAWLSTRIRQLAPHALLAAP
jgi:hypothetical protein